MTTNLRGPFESTRSHHLDVRPGDWKNGSRAVRSSAHNAKGLRLLPHVRGGPCGDHRVGGEEGGQVGLHPDGTHSRATSAVGDAEGLVKVQVGHVAAVISRTAKTYLGVHVCPIQVDLFNTWSVKEV